ncbi:MAG TPA: AMP-binding protein [Cyclobacteriaceae bacterium]|nr:AMP-binding protein [Cyclobacteriaceae bacterium]
MTSFLEMNGVRYSLDRLDEALRAAPTPFYADAIQFCRDWIAQRDQFTFHTSGSTGTPKQISFTRSQLITSARLSAEALNLQAGDTALVCLDTRLIAGAMMLVRSMVVGMNILLEQPSANPVQGTSSPMHFAALVPYQVVSILQTNPASLQRIKTVIIGGAPLQASSLAVLKTFTNHVYATYGMTETITHIALQQLSGKTPQEHFHALNTISLSTDNRECLVIHAPHLGQPPIITNDRVQLIDDKTFVWMGRIDRVINSGGKKIQPEYIEQIVESLLGNQGLNNRFFVAGLPDPLLGESVTLFIEGILARDVQDHMLKALESRLTRHGAPKSIICLEQFNETASQKVNRLATIRNTSKK